MTPLNRAFQHQLQGLAWERRCKEEKNKNKKKNQTAVNFGTVQERSFFPFTLISGLHGWHMEHVLGTPWPGAPVLQVGL